MSSTEHLPELGLQHVEMRERRSMFAERAGGSGRFSADTHEGVAANNLLQLIPRTEQRRKVAQVRRLLTLGFAQSAWAQAAAASEQLHLASVVDRVVPAELDDVTRSYETVRLTTLVLGAIEGVCTGSILPAESEQAVVRHLKETFAAWLSEPRTGAA